MICSGKERFFADLLATRRRRIKSELTQHPFLYVDRLLEKPRNSTSGVFRFLGLVLALPHHDPMPWQYPSTLLTELDRTSFTKKLASCIEYRYSIQSKRPPTLTNLEQFHDSTTKVRVVCQYRVLYAKRLRSSSPRARQPSSTRLNE